jgi:hypothetical protein
MGRRSVRSFVENVKQMLNDEFSGRYFESENDAEIIKSWFKINVPVQWVHYFFEKNKEELPETFSLKDINDKFLKWFLRKKVSECVESDSWKFTHQRIRLISEIVKTVLRVFSVRDEELAKRAKSLGEEKDLLKVEQELIKIEEELYEKLKETEDGKSCWEFAQKNLEPFKDLWKEKVFVESLQEVYRTCMKKKLKLPDFSVV